jgi:hypothetical protein
MTRENKQGRRDGERGIWQRRFWEHVIRDERDLTNHIAYTHYHPVKHGLVKEIDDWPATAVALSAYDQSPRLIVPPTADRLRSVVAPMETRQPF